MGARVVAYQVVYVVLHYLHDWFPNRVTRMLGSVNESVYQHMKTGFFAIIIMAPVEYLLGRGGFAATADFVLSRMFAATFLPLVMLVVYLLSPLVFVRIGSIAGEVVFANLALLATSVSTFTIEAHLFRSAPSLHFKLVVAALFVISLAQFHVFTGRLPWFDLFAQPPGWPEAKRRS